MYDDGERAEQLFRIEAMKGEIQEIAEGECVFGEMNGDISPDIEEQFLEHVLAYERAEMVRHADLLARDGVALPAPDELSDDELALKLIEVIHALANRRTYLSNTNHLSDRELYTHLCEETLNEWCPDLPADDPMNCHIDLVGSGSEEDIALYLTYYADEETRAEWATDSPDALIPPHQDPPYTRDQHLPKMQLPPNPFDDPAVDAAWCTEHREKILRKLDELEITHGEVSESPEWYMPPLVGIWTVDDAELTGVTAWWAMAGELPTIIRTSDELPDARTFMETVSRFLFESAEALECNEPPTELMHVPVSERPRAARVLRHRAEILDECVKDESMWGDEE